MIRHRYILAAFLFLLFSSVFSQPTVVLTPVSPKPNHSSLEDDQPIIEPTASATVNPQTPQPSVTSSGDPVSHDNFQSMSDLHKDALAQATQTTAIPSPTKVWGKDFFDEHRFQIEWGGGVNFLGSDFNSAYGSAGLDHHLALGLLLNDHWSLWLSQDFKALLPPSTAQSSFYYNPYGYNALTEQDFWDTTFMLRYTFDGSPVRPYLMLGGGVIYNGYNAGAVFENGDYYTNPASPMLQLGLGLQFPLNDVLSFFVEAKAELLFETLNYYEYTSYTSGFFTYYNYNTDSVSSVLTDFPVNAGIVFNLFGNEPPSTAPTSAPPESFFLKIGGGPAFISNLYNQNGYPITGTNFISSAEAGIDFPSHLSIYGSADQYPGFLAAMANLRYNIAFRTHFFDPYVFLGFGLNLPENTAGLTPSDCLQFGLGMEFHLSPETALFFETKVLASNLSSVYQNANYSTLLSGLKFNFPPQIDNAAPTKVFESGNGFIEIAGSVDTPAQNWQSAYTATDGSVISAGYEFKDGLALQLDLENFNFNGSNFLGPISDNMTRILPTVRYHLFSGVLRPYVLAGLGTEMEFSTSFYGNAMVAYLDAAMGLGADMPLGDKISLFAEGKYNWVFAYNVVGQDIPVLAGVRCGF